MTRSGTRPTPRSDFEGGIITRLSVSTYMVAVLIMIAVPAAANAQDRVENLSSLASRSLSFIRAGQTVEGVLEAGDVFRTESETYADAFFYEGRAGETITVTLNSPDFDPWLVVDDPASALRETSGGRSRPSRLVVKLFGANRYTIVANTVDKGKLGRYTLTVESDNSGVAAKDLDRVDDISSLSSRPLPVIRVGQTVDGSLEPRDIFLTDDKSFADAYFYDGRAGETITVTQRSSELDSWLVVEGISVPFRKTNDDGGGGGDSRLVLTLPNTARYLILANAIGYKFGNYTLTVDIANQAGTRK